MLTHSLFCPLSHFHPYYDKMVTQIPAKIKRDASGRLRLASHCNAPSCKPADVSAQSGACALVWLCQDLTHLLQSSFSFHCWAFQGLSPPEECFPRRPGNPCPGHFSAYRPSVADESRTRLQLWLNSRLLPDPHNGYWVLTAPQAGSGQKS